MTGQSHIAALEREIAEHHDMRERTTYIVNVHEGYWGVWPFPAGGKLLRSDGREMDLDWSAAGQIEAAA